MRIVCGAFLALSLAVFLCLPAGASAQGEKSVTFATDPEKAGGFLLELTVEAFKKVGYETHVEFMPWARAVMLAARCDVDGLLGCYYSDERAQKLAYSHVLAESPLVFFARRDANIAYATLKDLSGLRIGTITGAAYPKEFEEASFLAKEPVSDYILNIKKLQARRIDLFVEKKFVVASFQKASSENAAADIVALDPPLAVNKYYNAFCKGTPRAKELLDDFNRGLRLLKEEGLYDIILKKGLHE